MPPAQSAMRMTATPAKTAMRVRRRRDRQPVAAGPAWSSSPSGPPGASGLAWWPAVVELAGLAWWLVGVGLAWVAGLAWLAAGVPGCAARVPWAARLPRSAWPLAPSAPGCPPECGPVAETAEPSGGSAGLRGMAVASAALLGRAADPAASSRSPEPNNRGRRMVGSEGSSPRGMSLTAKVKHAGQCPAQAIETPVHTAPMPALPPSRPPARAGLACPAARFAQSVHPRLARLARLTGLFGRPG